MATMTELVEASVDWRSTLPRRERATLWRIRDNGVVLVLHELNRRERVIKYATPPPPGRLRKTAEAYYREFMDELHELLCSEGGKYAEDRANIVQEYKAGQATLVAGLTASLAPYLSAISTLLPALVALTLTVIGRVGLSAWCAAQARRKRERKKGQEESQDV